MTDNYQRGFTQALHDYELLRRNHSHEDTIELLRDKYAWELKSFWLTKKTVYTDIITKWYQGYLSGIESKETE